MIRKRLRRAVKAAGEDCVDPGAAEKAAEAITKLEDVLHEVQHALGSALPEGTNDQIVSDVTVALDGPKQRAAERAARAAIGRLKHPVRKVR